MSALPPPPGPFRPDSWRSPLRGPWLTSVLGSLLLPMIVIVGITGLLSHAAYNPGLGRNSILPADQDVGFLTFDWPSGFAFLYAITQSAHVLVGIVAIPVLLAKLWSVIPKLFAWPVIASPAMAIERLGVALLVGSATFEFATGVANIQLFYAFRFNFVEAHYYGGLVFLGSLAVHVLSKLPVIRRAYRERGVLRPLRDDLAHTRPEPPDPDGGLAPVNPAAPTLSRRGLLGLVGGASGLLFLVTAGQHVGGPFRSLALLAPRNRDLGSGPNAFPVNKTAQGAGITAEMVRDWQLELRAGDRTVALSRDDLLAMELRTEDLPIACVEGWTTTQAWTGVPIAELARLAGAGEGATVFVRSLQEGSALADATLSADQVANPRSLLALRVNGADLSPDHGFPARIIVPALPGVHNTKWVRTMEFRA